MRKLTNGSTTVEVYGWAMLRNCWEYFFLDAKESSDIRFALVYGDETEMGDVSMEEAKPYIIGEVCSDDMDKAELSPPPGWDWV